jgi:hypothetical protein
MLNSWTYSFQTCLHWSGLLPHPSTAELQPFLCHIYQPHTQEGPFHLSEGGIVTIQGIFMLSGALAVTLPCISSPSFFIK